MTLNVDDAERLAAIQASKKGGRPSLDTGERPAEKNGAHPPAKKKPRVRDRAAERTRSLARAAAARAADALTAPKALEALDRIAQLQAVAAVRDQVGGEQRLKQL